MPEIKAQYDGVFTSSYLSVQSLMASRWFSSLSVPRSISQYSARYLDGFTFMASLIQSTAAYGSLSTILPSMHMWAIRAQAAGLLTSNSGIIVENISSLNSGSYKSQRTSNSLILELSNPSSISLR